VSSFGHYLRQLRQAAGLTQEELAERAGLTADGIGVLERGARRRPQPHTVRALATALGLNDAERAALVAAVPGRGDAVVEAAAPATLRSPGVGQSGLPASLTTLVGREGEIDAVLGLLGRPDVRLLTLTGPGGVGKTRLAIAVAGLAEDFPAGVAFVALAPLHDPAGVLGTVAEALGVRDSGGPSALNVLTTALRDHRALLLLDNFEQVAEAAGEVAALLLACPGLKILVTSRAALRVGGEQEYRVTALALPTDDRALAATLAVAPAVRLFVERARLVAPDFALTATNGAAVAAICRRLDGLPLAIELAAARVALLPPPILLDRLERGLPTLGEGPRDLPERQRTLRRTLAWSHDLLGECERRLYRRLAVFSGGCTVEAVEAVCGDEGEALAEDGADTLSSLAALVDQSLLLRAELPPDTPDMPGTPRLVLLETIREDALARLAASGEAETYRRRHADYYLALLERSALDLTGAQQAAWGALVAPDLLRERDNFRAALTWAREHDRVELALRLAGLLWSIWAALGTIDAGRRDLEATLALDGADADEFAAVRARALHGVGVLAETQGDWTAAHDYYAASLALRRALDDRLGIARSVLSVGYTVLERGDGPVAEAAFMEARDRYRDLGDQRGAAYAISGLGYIALYAGDTVGSRPLHRESLAIYRAIDDPRGIAHALAGLGYVALAESAFDEARALHEESLAQSRALGDRGSVVHRLSALGTIALLESDTARAADYLREGVALANELGGSEVLSALYRDLALIALRGGDLPRAVALLGESVRLARRHRGADTAVTLDYVARVAGVAGLPQRCALLHGAAAALREQIGAPMPPTEQQEWEPIRDAARARLGDAAWVARCAEGRGLSLARALAAARDVLTLVQSGARAAGEEQAETR